jgi:hypothetical protein
MTIGAGVPPFHSGATHAEQVIPQFLDNSTTGIERIDHSKFLATLSPGFMKAANGAFLADSPDSGMMYPHTVGLASHICHENFDAVCAWAFSSDERGRIGSCDKASK